MNRTCQLVLMDHRRNTIFPRTAVNLHVLIFFFQQSDGRRERAELFLGGVWGQGKELRIEEAFEFMAQYGMLKGWSFHAFPPFEKGGCGGICCKAASTSCSILSRTLTFSHKT